MWSFYYVGQDYVHDWHLRISNFDGRKQEKFVSDRRILREIFFPEDEFFV